MKNIKAAWIVLVLAVGTLSLFALNYPDSPDVTYDLFSRKATDETISGNKTYSGTSTFTGAPTVTGQNITIDTASKTLVFEDGSGVAKGSAGTIAFVSGGLTIISNSAVTASSLVFLTSRTANPNAGIISATNAAGLGFQLVVPAGFEQTNTYGYFTIKVQ